MLRLLLGLFGLLPQRTYMIDSTTLTFTLKAGGYRPTFRPLTSAERSANAKRAQMMPALGSGGF